jgi:hypothetical protein
VVPFDDEANIGYPSRESPVIAGGGRDLRNDYRRVTGISSRGQVTAQQFMNGVSETTTYDDSTGLFLSIAASGLSHETLAAACSTATYSMVKQLAYTYDLFDNLRRQTKSFYLREANGHLECSGSSAVATATASELSSYDDLQAVDQCEPHMDRHDLVAADDARRQLFLRRFGQNLVQERLR